MNILLLIALVDSSSSLCVLSVCLAGKKKIGGVAFVRMKVQSFLSWASQASC